MLVLVSGGGGDCSGMLLLHPLLTCADAGPDLCTFCPGLGPLPPDLCSLGLWCYPSISHDKVCGIFPSAIGVITPCTGGGATCCNLRWWSFSSHPLALEQLALCGGGSCMWRWWWDLSIYLSPYIYIYTSRASPPSESFHCYSTP